MPCVDTVIARYNWIQDRRDYLAADAIDTADALQAAIDNEAPLHVLRDLRAAHVAAFNARDDYEDGPDRAWLTGRDIH